MKCGGNKEMKKDMNETNEKKKETLKKGKCGTGKCG